MYCSKPATTWRKIQSQERLRDQKAGEGRPARAWISDMMDWTEMTMEMLLGAVRHVRHGVRHDRYDMAVNCPPCRQRLQQRSTTMRLNSWRELMAVIPASFTVHIILNSTVKELLCLRPIGQRNFIKRCFCLTSVCLSVAYIRPNSRTERPRKTKNWHRGRTRHTWFGHNFQGQKAKGQLVAECLKCQHAGTGATWRINAKILSTCRGRRHIVTPRAQLV